MTPPLARTELVDLLEAFLLGEEPSLTGQQLADEVGIPFEEARLRWSSLGFSAVGADVTAFTHADLEALRLTQRLREIGLIEPEDESALVRTLGRSFARLAEWQIGLLARVVDVDTMDLEQLRATMDEVTTTVESLQSYVWRRHTLSAASRMLLADPREDEGDGEQVEGRTPDQALGVGFADIVNYTRQSRSATRSEIARMIDRFEERALEVASSHGGRIIKSIGDEILFVADDPAGLARIGLDLAGEHARDDDFPELRVGLAWGRALARLGDVLGPVVNVAARLTSTSRPGRVLVDRALADLLRDDDALRLRRLRRTSVKGYRKLEPWSLRRSGDDPGDDSDQDSGQDSSQDSSQDSGDGSGEQREDVAGVVDEVGPGGEGPVGAQGADQRPGR